MGPSGHITHVIGYIGLYCTVWDRICRLCIWVAQLVVGTTSKGYLSSWSQVRAQGGERNPCELGGYPLSRTTPRRSGPGGGALTQS